MAIVPRSLRSGKIAYWVTFDWNGKTRWERAGTDKREAERLEAQRKAEVLAGTYHPEIRGTVTVKSWISTYFAKRTNRTKANDEALIENHVLCRQWIASMLIQRVRPRDMLRLVEEIRAEKKLGEKSLSTVYGIVRGAFRRALFEEVIATDPTDLPRGTIRWKSARANKRKPYTREEALTFTSHPELVPQQRMWNALAVYTGMREGEVCGRRWKDWLRDWSPLTALSVHSQYDDQPLKGDDDEDTRPRMVPVHPELERALRTWWLEGWELVYRRKPTPEDFIVPTAGGEFCHSKSSAYRLFQRGLVKVGVENKTLHATRHTFISVARSNGADKDVLERVTHNARGETIDEYTTFEWRTLCKAVRFFDLNLDPNANVATFPAPEPGLEAGSPGRNVAKASGKPGSQASSGSGEKHREMPGVAAQVDAGQSGDPEAMEWAATLAEHQERAEAFAC